MAFAVAATGGANVGFPSPFAPCVTMVINVDAKTVNTSYYCGSGAIEFMQAEILSFEDQE